MIITILAGGFSASLCDLRRLPGLVIAVNDAAIYAPKWDIAVSMDRMWAEHRIEQIRASGKRLWLRRSTVKNFVIDATDQQVALFDNDHLSTTMSEDPDTLNGTHSGFCALNLAYHMRPTDLYLVGFDMAHGPRGERHWYPPYPWKNGGGSSEPRLYEWAQQFTVASKQLERRQIRVALVTAKTTIKCFDTVHPKDFQ